MARNRTLRPVFPRLPFVFGTVSAERFADSFGCHCQHVLRHIDVTPLPRACVDQKPGTLCCQTAWHVFLHVLPTLIYHASVNAELCLPSFDPFCKLSFGMVHVIMIDATTTCYLMCVYYYKDTHVWRSITPMRTCHWTLIAPHPPPPHPTRA